MNTVKGLLLRLQGSHLGEDRKDQMHPGLQCRLYFYACEHILTPVSGLALSPPELWGPLAVKRSAAAVRVMVKNQRALQSRDVVLTTR